MDFNEFVSAITPEIYQNLKRAVETGKWPDGRTLSAEERETSMQAVIAYDAKHQKEHDRIGQLPDADCSTKNNLDAFQPFQNIKFVE